MTSDWTTGIHEGYRTKVVKIGNNIVEINRPILDAAEQAKREQQVKDALLVFGKTIERSVRK